MIAVFDTNVLIAAIVTQGLCSKILYRARAGEFSLISCPFIQKELNRVPSRKFRLVRKQIATVLEPVEDAIYKVIEHSITVEGISRDADDDNILACAVAAKADYLVTGDTDLLDLKRFKGVRIVTPRDFEALFF